MGDKVVVMESQWSWELALVLEWVLLWEWVSGGEGLEGLGLMAIPVTVGRGGSWGWVGSELSLRCFNTSNLLGDLGYLMVPQQVTEGGMDLDSVVMNSTTFVSSSTLD